MPWKTRPEKTKISAGYCSADVFYVPHAGSNLAVRLAGEQSCGTRAKRRRDR